MFKEFKAFITRGNVLDLAVAVIIGAAFGKIVTVADRRHHHAGDRQDLRRARFLELFRRARATVPAALAGSTDYAALKKAGVPLLGYGEFITAGGQFRDRRLHHLPDGPRGEPHGRRTGRR